MTQDGYALVDAGGNGFSWHATRVEAEQRRKYEAEIFGRYLSVVPAHSAIKWPDVYQNYV